MTDITEAQRIALATIPPEAVEAAARAYSIAHEGHDEWWHLRADRVAAALRAGIAAWPGMHKWDTGQVWHQAAFILPLPQEKTNAEG